MAIDPQLFAADFTDRLKRFRLAKRRSTGALGVGTQQSPRVGTGHDFVERREYLPGDDYRQIDWGVYARHGELFIKQFAEESGTAVFLCIDCSESMSVGTPPKFDLARQVAAGLGYLALGAFDHVSILGFANQIVDYLPLVGGQAQLIRSLEFLSQMNTVGESRDFDPIAVADAIRQRSTSGGTVVWISDLLFRPQIALAIEPLSDRGIVSSIVQIYAVEDACPTAHGLCQLDDAESGASTIAMLDQDIIKSYERAFGVFLKSIREDAIRAGVPIVQTNNQSPYDHVLTDWVTQ